jgi:hypothetical protein
MDCGKQQHEPPTNMLNYDEIMVQCLRTCAGNNSVKDTTSLEFEFRIRAAAISAKIATS